MVEVLEVLTNKSGRFKGMAAWQQSPSRHKAWLRRP